MIVEQFVNARKANIDALFVLTGKAFEYAAQLVELNISTAKAATADAAQSSKLALSAKDPQELLSLQASLLQQAAEKAAAYGSKMCEIAASTGGEATRVAEVQSAKAQAEFVALVDTVGRNAPAGIENGVALIKSAVTAASNAIEMAQEAAKQAAEVAETNFKAMTSTAFRSPKAKQG